MSEWVRETERERERERTRKTGKKYRLIVSEKL